MILGNAYSTSSSALILTDPLDFQPCLVLKAYLRLIYKYLTAVHDITVGEVNMSRFVSGKHECGYL